VGGWSAGVFVNSFEQILRILKPHTCFVTIVSGHLGKTSITFMEEVIYITTVVTLLPV